MKLSLSATLPDTQSGKLLVDYANKQVNIKTSVGLTTQPKVREAECICVHRRCSYRVEVAAGVQGLVLVAVAVPANTGLDTHQIQQ